MSQVEIFDRAMCCSTGVCGPQVDPVLPRFAADLDWLARQGHQVRRYNLAQDPAAFAASTPAQAMLAESGVECLPLVVVDGEVVSRGDYPSREALAGWTGTTVVRAASLPLASPASEGCGGDDCC